MEYAMAPMSLAHTFGNVTAFMSEFVKGLFPPNYFKTVTISSSIAYKHFNLFDNNNREFIKKNKPILIIRPRVDFSNDSDIFLNGTYLTQRITDNFMDLDMGNLQPFIEDPKNGLYIKYLLNRMRMFFDVTIIVESQMEQLNQAMYLKNRVRQDHPFDLQTALESNVPRDLIKMVMTDAKIDINDTKATLDYLNAQSYYPVTYKLKNSTGNDEFFRYYPVHIDTMLTGLSLDDGSKKGFVSDSYAINFTVNTEFNTAGLYYYLTRNPETIRDFQVSIMNDSDSIIPVFTISNLFEDISLPQGWNMYASPMYKVERDNLPDVLQFESLLNRSLNSAIDYHLEKGIPLAPMIKTFVMKDNVRLNEEINEYSIDYSTRELTTNNSNITSTYRMLIYVNTLYVNNFIKDILHLEEEI